MTVVVDVCNTSLVITISLSAAAMYTDPVFDAQVILLDGRLLYAIERTLAPQLLTVTLITFLTKTVDVVTGVVGVDSNSTNDSEPMLQTTFKV